MAYMDTTKNNAELWFKITYILKVISIKNFMYCFIVENKDTTPLFITCRIMEYLYKPQKICEMKTQKICARTWKLNIRNKDRKRLT